MVRVRNEVLGKAHSFLCNLEVSSDAPKLNLFQTLELSLLPFMEKERTILTPMFQTNKKRLMTHLPLQIQKYIFNFIDNKLINFNGSKEVCD